MQELIIDTIDHYRLQQLLARGGMGQVYLAQDTQTGKQVAIKLVHSSAAEYSKRFRFEAETLAKLSHEHILPVISYGECGLWHYLVTPYVPGGTLSQRLKQGPFSCEHAGELLDQLAQTLHFAHQQGLIHRDIKASNILMRDEHFIYLADFGLAKYIDETGGFTLSGSVVGTPEYMAPELAEQKATSLSDLYSLGILLYQMLTGKLPFTGNNPLNVCIQHLQDFPPLPSSFNSNIPQTVECVILRALEKYPQKRFQTVREFSQAYWQALREDRQKQMMTVTQLRIPVLKLPKASGYNIRQGRRRPSLAASLLGLACIGVLFGLSAGQQGKPPLPVYAQQQPIAPYVQGVKPPTSIPPPTSVPHSGIAESPPSPANSQHTPPPDSRGASQSANYSRGSSSIHQSSSNQNNVISVQQGGSQLINSNGGGSNIHQSSSNQNNVISGSWRIKASQNKRRSSS